MVFVAVYILQYSALVVANLWFLKELPPIWLLVSVVTLTNLGGVFNFAAYTLMRRKKRRTENERGAAEQSQTTANTNGWNRGCIPKNHYSDVIMGGMASQITSLAIVYSTVCSGADQRKHQSSASLAFVRRIHRWLVNSPHNGPVTRKMFSFDDVIIFLHICVCMFHCKSPTIVTMNAIQCHPVITWSVLYEMPVE